MSMAVGHDATRLAGPTITKAADLNRGLLEAAGLEYEPVVMLESTETGLVVRKLTAAEKIAHSERTGEAPFAGSDEDLDQLFAAIPAADDPA
jgi:hypothetical protein